MREPTLEWAVSRHLARMHLEAVRDDTPAEAIRLIREVRLRAAHPCRTCTGYERLLCDKAGLSWAEVVPT
jgi:hypothetical protein